MPPATSTSPFASLPASLAANLQATDRAVTAALEHHLSRGEPTLREGYSTDTTESWAQDLVKVQANNDKLRKQVEMQRRIEKEGVEKVAKELYEEGEKLVKESEVMSGRA